MAVGVAFTHGIGVGQHVWLEGLLPQDFAAHLRLAALGGIVPVPRVDAVVSS